MENILKVASDPVMITLSILLVSIIVITAIIFGRHAKKFAEDTNLLTREEMKIAIRTGAKASLGPAIAIVFLAVGMITQLGGAITFMRVGIIGAAPLETILASIGAAAAGGPLGSSDFDLYALTAALWTMVLVVSGWLIVVFFLTERMANIQDNVTKKSPKLMLTIAGVVPLMIFFILVADKFQTGPGNMFAIIASAITMYILQKLGKTPKLKWVLEWSMGFSMVVGMFVASIIIG